jgi:hypothetical protein
VGDAEIDHDLSGSVKLVQADLTAAAHAISACPGEFAAAWAEHFRACSTELDGANQAARLTVASRSRLSSVRKHVESVSATFTACEDPNFPLNVPRFKRVSLHLDKLIECCVGARRTEMSFMAARAAQYRRREVDESAYAEFRVGFSRIDAVEAGRRLADIGAHREDTLSFKILLEVSRLLQAHAEAFSRNYSIGLKSTGVTSRLIHAYCASVTDTYAAARDATQGYETLESVRAAVDLHCGKLQAIQSQFDDRSVYSRLGAQRLLALLHLCSLLGEVTYLSIFLSVSRDEAFEYDEAHSRVRELSIIFTQFSIPFDPLRLAFAELEDLASSVQDDLSAERYQRWLEGLANFGSVLSATMHELLEIPDRRVWRLASPGQSKLTELLLRDPPNDPSASMGSLKVGLDKLSQTLPRLKASLDDEDLADEGVGDEIGAFDEAAATWSRVALSVNGGEAFRALVRSFIKPSAALVTQLRAELDRGTIGLRSGDVNAALAELERVASSLAGVLGLLELVEDRQDRGVLLRLAKLLRLAGDDLSRAVPSGDKGLSAATAALVSAVYDAVVGVLLAVHNSPAAVQTALYGERKRELLNLVVAAQKLIFAGSGFPTFLATFESSAVESPEFLFKATFEPVTAALREVIVSLPQAIPGRGQLYWALGETLRAVELAIEPQYEERPGLQEL